MISPRMLVLALFLSAVVLGSSGCGRRDLPQLGRVRGTVTLDGQPLSNAEVQFFPDTGRTATALTNERGEYDLTYIHGVYGTKLGPNTVVIEWPYGEPGPVRIPSRYGANTELKADVQPGRNRFDFALESE